MDTLITHGAIWAFGFLCGFLLGEKSTRRIFGKGLTKIGFWMQESASSTKKHDDKSWKVDLSEKEKK
jgi:hypothetical protein